MPTSRPPVTRPLSVLVLLVMAVTLSGCLNDFDEERLNRVWIHGIDVAAPTVGSGTVTLLVNVTLENRDDQSGDLTLLVKAYNTATGLHVATREADAGTIARDRAKTVPVTLELAKEDGYRITVVLFQDEERLQQATVQVSKVSALANTVAQTGLRVADLEFLVRNVTDGRVRIEAQVYLTNEGTSDPRPLRLHVKAREASTGLLAEEAWTDVGNITPEATRIETVDLVVPDAYNYIVEAVLWDGQFIVGKGQGKVQLLPTFTVPKDDEVVVDRPEVRDFIREEGGAGDSSDDGEYSEGAPGPTAILLLAALAALLILARRRN